MLTNRISRSLKLKVTLLVLLAAALPLIGCVTLMGYLAWQRELDDARDRLVYALAESKRELIQVSAPSLSHGLLNRLRDASLAGGDQFRVVLRDAGGSDPMEPISPQELAGSEFDNAFSSSDSITRGWVHDDRGRVWFSLRLSSPELNRDVEAALDRALIARPVIRELRVLVISGLVCFIVYSVVVSMLLRKWWSPFHLLVQDTERVADGDLWHEIQVTRSDDLGKLQGAIESMRGSMKHQIDHLDALIAERTAELEYVNEQLERDSREDKLTGLANRDVMLEAIERELSRAQRDASQIFAVLFFDFDRFKIVNDSLGHATGDALLCSIADRFRQHMRAHDTAARFGGDEFVVCLTDLESDEEAALAANRLLSVFEAPHDINGHRLISTASIGLVIYDERYANGEEMIRDADAAMYEAKSAGKGQVMNFDLRMHDEAQRRIRIEDDISHAIDRDELFLVYQPIVQIDQMKLIGFEALVRWNHPERGLVRPDHFISIAEDTGQIVEIGAWVLEEAVRQLQSWDNDHGIDKDLEININVAKRQLIHPRFIDSVRDTIQKYDVDPSRIKLEITESTAIDPRHDMTGVIREVKALGVQIAMDDFGTGHSSLSLLHELNLDVIKIDKSFIDGMNLSRELGAVLQSIIALAHNLGKTVVAEGVETQDQVVALLSHGCDQIQGYFFSKPLESEEATRFIHCADRMLDAA